MKNVFSRTFKLQYIWVITQNGMKEKLLLSVSLKNFKSVSWANTILTMFQNQLSISVTCSVFDEERIDKRSSVYTRTEPLHNTSQCKYTRHLWALTNNLTNNNLINRTDLFSHIRVHTILRFIAIESCSRWSSIVNCLYNKPFLPFMCVLISW